MNTHGQGGHHTTSTHRSTRGSLPFKPHEPRRKTPCLFGHFSRKDSKQRYQPDDSGHHLPLSQLQHW